MNHDNYLTYRKQPSDRRYRIVSLTSGGVGEFQEFDSMLVRYQAQQAVLEVMDEHGETRIIYDAERDLIVVSRLSQNLIALPRHIPLQRLWVKPKNGRGVCYKVVGVLNPDTNKNEIWIPAGIGKVELVGDRFFNAAYILQ